ncbi:hypothetical protein [Caldanaerobius polysaccharolyticus]|uniref:hypothetical protein n=1 Tax=Caldanaerobius polysaccharolyticus TaxID=44256 RepID=UPI000478C6BB|nr:hypothetical protein [Caldanaerobius polysaccharolyticus]
MAKFLIVSALAETIGLAIRLLAEGHEVKYYIHEKSEKDCGDGFIEKVDDWREYVDWCDVLFFDDVDQKEKGETAYASGNWYLEVREKYPDKLILGGHPNVARLENDRMFAQEILQQVGVPIVPLQRFTNFQEAKNFVEKNGGGWAIKHNSQVDRDLAGVFFKPEEVIEFLDWLEQNWKELAKGKPVDFVLQQAVKGVEFAVTSFFDGERFRSEFCYLNQEEKKELDGGLGRSTGQMGEIGIVVPNARLFQQTLAKIEPLLREWGYCGFADLNCIVTGPDKVVPLEFTIGRPGYPTLYSISELLDEPVGQFLIRMAQRDPQPIKTREGFVCTLILATGTFPDQHPTRNKTAVVHGLDKTGLRHVWLGEARWEDGKVLGAGDMGYLAVITGSGWSIEEARTKAYDTISQISVTPYEKYRMDIGLRAMEEFPQLAAWRWLS